MTDAWVSAITMQGYMIGGFFDAQAHSSAMLALQTLSAEAMADYTPGEALCRYGSLTKSLASSDALGRHAKIALSERAQNRQMLNKNMNSAYSEIAGREAGRAADKVGRLDQFIGRFCDKTSSNGALTSVCAAGLSSRAIRRDIDYAQSFDVPLTLNLNFSGASPVSQDQQNLFALADNLYAHDLVFNLPRRDELDALKDDNQIAAFIDFRTAIAQRSVAENSFASIAALKTPGTDASTSYMRAIMKEMGMSDSDTDRMIGRSNPSYYAQMEILTRRLYQNPRFYAELMDKPANVVRQQAAMKSISLMQDRDIQDSLQRSEMLLSTLLGVYAAREQQVLLDKTRRSKE